MAGAIAASATRERSRLFTAVVLRSISRLLGDFIIVMLAGGTGAVTSGADPGRPNRVVWPSTWCMTSSPCLMIVFRLLCTFFDSIANPLAISERVIVPPLARRCSSNLAGSEPAFGA